MFFNRCGYSVKIHGVNKESVMLTEEFFLSSYLNDIHYADFPGKLCIHFRRAILQR
jgi:hypothetical protein